MVMLMDFRRFICTFEKYILGWIEKLIYWAGYYVLVQYVVTLMLDQTSLTLLDKKSEQL